jgi:hypothetical protein
MLWCRLEAQGGVAAALSVVGEYVKGQFSACGITPRRPVLALLRQGAHPGATWERRDAMPELAKLYIRQCLIGFGLSAVFVALLIGLDVVGLRGLVMTTEGGFLALFLLFFFNGLVFAGVQFGMTIMRMGQADDHDGGRRDPIEVAPEAALVPIRVETEVAGPQRP